MRFPNYFLTFYGLLVGTGFLALRYGTLYMFIGPYFFLFCIDASQDVESDKDDKDPRTTSLTLEKSKASLASHGQDIGGCGDNLSIVNQSNELAEKQCKEVSNVDDRNFIPAISGRSIVPCDENKLLQSPPKKTNELPMLEKKMSTGASDNIVQNDVGEIRNGVRGDEIAVSAENTKLLCRDSSGDSKPRGISCSEKDTKSTQMQNDVHSEEDLKLNASRCDCTSLLMA